MFKLLIKKIKFVVAIFLVCFFLQFHLHFQSTNIQQESTLNTKQILKEERMGSYINKIKRYTMNLAEIEDCKEKQQWYHAPGTFHFSSNWSIESRLWSRLIDWLQAIFLLPLFRTNNHFAWTFENGAKIVYTRFGGFKSKHSFQSPAIIRLLTFNIRVILVEQLFLFFFCWYNINQ